MVIYRDVKLKLNPKDYMRFIVPHGIDVIWDPYNFKEQTVVGRFMVSENHLHEDERKNEIFLNTFLDSLGDYVISFNAKNQGLKDVRFGQFTSTWMDHPYTEDLPKDIDIHIPDSHNQGSITKQELEAINYGIKYDSYRSRTLKKYRDERFKPKENSKGEYDVYVGVLEEIPK